tara:strand:+ start:693 stop:1289 length:597 start_codon:yes stop_codon:yes gene_type:complete
MTEKERTMKKAYLTGIAYLMLAATLSAPALALTVGGVDVPDTYTANSTELQLNGAGTRSKFFIDLYVGSLYVPKAQHDGNAVVDADEPQAITLHITSDMITSDRMTEATMDGFEASTGGDMAPIQSEIDQFMSVFKEEIKEGDVFDLVYVPGEGVKVFKNSEQKGTVGDLEFKKALFGIWLSDEPAQKSLKKKMLGQG